MVCSKACKTYEMLKAFIYTVLNVLIKPNDIQKESRNHILTTHKLHKKVVMNCMLH